MAKLDEIRDPENGKNITAKIEDNVYWGYIDTEFFTLPPAWNAGPT